MRFVNYKELDVTYASELLHEPIVREALGRDDEGVIAARWEKISSQSSRLPELMVATFNPSRFADSIWFSMSARSGLMMSVGPAPLRAQDLRGHEVDERLAPTRLLHPRARAHPSRRRRSPRAGPRGTLPPRHTRREGGRSLGARQHRARERERRPVPAPLHARTPLLRRLPSRLPSSTPLHPARAR